MPLNTHTSLWLLAPNAHRLYRNGCKRFMHNNQISTITPALNTLVESHGDTLTLTLHGNPSRCDIAFAGPAGASRQLVCDCAPGYTGTTDCRSRDLFARAQQPFASLRAGIRVIWPTALRPSVSRATMPVLSLPLNCGADNFFTWTPATVAYGIGEAGRSQTTLGATVRLADGTFCGTPTVPELDWLVFVRLDGFRLSVPAGSEGTVVLSGFANVNTIPDGTYDQQAFLHEGKPWYWRRGNNVKLYWHVDPDLWLVGTELGSLSAFAYNPATVSDAGSIPPTSRWAAAAAGGTFVDVVDATSTSAVGRLDVNPAMHIQVVNSAFEHADAFATPAPAIVAGETLREARIPITQERLGWPFPVRGNPNLPTIIRFHLRAKRRWIIDVGRSNTTRKTVRLPQDGLAVEATPVNPQLPEWQHVRFTAAIQGDLLTVTRIDGRLQAWEQPLQLLAISAEDATCLSVATVVPLPPGQATAGAHALRVASPLPIRPDACTLQLVAEEGTTAEELPVSEIRLNITDCQGRCGVHGRCSDSSGSPYDGVWACECMQGYAGRLCELEQFKVTWDEQEVAVGTLGQEFVWRPSGFLGRQGARVLLQDEVLYAASSLPFGVRLDPESGAIRGRPLEAGRFTITILAVLRGRNETNTRVNDQFFPFAVAECSDDRSCNGGRCTGSDGANCSQGDCPTAGGSFDGAFLCDCSSTGFVGPRCDLEPERPLQVEWPGADEAWPDAVVAVPYSRPAPPRVVVFGATETADITYLASGLPCGLRIDTTSGGISGIPGIAEAHDGISIIASVGNKTTVVNQGVFSLNVRDCDDANTCNGGRCIDAAPFDGEFECDCNGTGKLGEFCGQDPASTANRLSGSGTLYVAVGTSCILLLLLVALIVVRYRKVQKKNRPLSFQEALENMKRNGLLAGSRENKREPRGPREITRKSVTVLEKIGEGAFGEVNKGFLDEMATRNVPGFTVALKVIKEETAGALREFTEEAALMADLRHANVISLIGVVTRGTPRMMVVPYCGNGDLRGFLQRLAGALNQKVQLAVCRDVADGMAYLTARNLVHRDLAARNVLIADDFSCKVSDFGMARQLAGDEAGDYYRWAPSFCAAPLLAHLHAWLPCGHHCASSAPLRLWKYVACTGAVQAGRSLHPCPAADPSKAPPSPSAGRLWRRWKSESTPRRVTCGPLGFSATKCSPMR